MRQHNISRYTLCKLKSIAAIFILAVVLVLGAGVQSSDAILTLKLYDGTNTIMIVDDAPAANIGDPYDAFGMTGGIIYNGSIGAFSFNLTTAFTTPLVGTDEQPQLVLTSVGVSSGDSGGTLTISLSETDYKSSKISAFSSFLGGTLSGTLDYNNYLDYTNEIFGKQHNIASLPTFYPGAFSGEYSEEITPSGELFSLTTEVILTHGSGNIVSSFGSQIRTEISPPSIVYAPEPVSSLLFLIGGALMAGKRFRNSRKAELSG